MSSSGTTTHAPSPPTADSACGSDGAQWSRNAALTSRPPRPQAIARYRTTASSSLTVAAARGSRDPWATATSGVRLPADPVQGGPVLGGGVQTWMPHSVLPVPAHRPLRGSAPASTRSVQVRQPIDGYPSYTSGFTSTPFVAM